MVFIFVKWYPPLILGCKNEKRLSGPTELDLEAGNLVLRGPQYQVELIERRIAIYILSIRSNQILKYSLYHITVPPFCEVKNILFIRPCLKEVIWPQCRKQLLIVQLLLVFCQFSLPLVLQYILHIMYWLHQVWQKLCKFLFLYVNSKEKKL